MRFTSTILAFLLTSATYAIAAPSLALVAPRAALNITDPLPPTDEHVACDFEAAEKYPDDIARLQSIAIKNYAYLLLVKKDVHAAFDAFVPGPVYIQHNPNVVSGREPIIEALAGGLWTVPDLVFDHVMAWAGEGYGLVHYRAWAREGAVHLSVMDRVRFQGTCIVEHWDLMQSITGKEPNPEAWF
ncbi:hypothetical protein DFP72DRAFT_871237 [Ephemerocybe angulata]|uniref:SnoaL-like domain-containing protein n=1 Tax=Ephemerocybe angulata TaxID=980116 RepID=A0A8H6MD93_9AGAR|nr:hypothetical protein DFP72DRAFT_871237 [Tulosesus angulatus]